tara:strand:- start:90 stop:482 length:393 start_codon:yes stop_codon:yes gene_type:complete
MNKSLKAALLSALILPGVGHFWLKKPLQGTLLTGITLICLYVLLNTVVDIAQRLSVQIQSGAIPVDITTIGERVSQQLAGSNAQLINIPTLILVICWVIGVLDSFRIGRSEEKTNALAVKQPVKPSKPAA